MASVFPIQPYGALQLDKIRRNSIPTWTYAAYISFSFHEKYLNDYVGRTNDSRWPKHMSRFIPTNFTYASSIHSWRRPSSVVLSQIPLDNDYGKDIPPLHFQIADGKDTSFIDILLQILHESARVISAELRNHETSQIYPKLSKAWVGIDVDAWKRHIPYQAAVYALIDSVLKIGKMLNDNHPVHNILSPKKHLILESLQEKFDKKDPKLAQWFAMEQLPALIRHITSALERHSSSYVDSGIAVIILAFSCCVAIGKLDAARISYPTFTKSITNAKQELLELSPDFASIDILHHFARKSGFEHEFLTYFGHKVLNHSARGNVIFWMGLLQEKLVSAILRENVVPNLQLFCHAEVQARDLAVIGLFSFLGRKTRLFLQQMGIKDLDEPVRAFICYLECGILFVYPELTSVCVYQLFIEVVSEEIGWLELYGTVPSTRHQERKRSKQHAIQAEKEIILSAVFGVCSDTFSSFEHYTKKNEQSLSSILMEYLEDSKSLLTSCQEDYWAAYDKLNDSGKCLQVQFPEPPMCTGNLLKATKSFPEKQYYQKPKSSLIANPSNQCIPQFLLGISQSTCSDRMFEKLPQAAETKPHYNFFAKSSSSILSTTSDVLTGTQLLWLDLKLTFKIIQRQIFGFKLTERERKKISRTLIDVACVIPIAILMILPVTAIGHAFMLSAIKKYIPGLIPSPYSADRLGALKQLKRAKKMKDQLCAAEWS